MRRMWAAGAAIVLCLVLGGLPAAGQEASPASSSAEPTPARPPAPPPAQPSDLRLTVLYDNTSASPELSSDWGFAALVEYGSHTLLFDTGAIGSILLGNMQQLGVDPSSIALARDQGIHARDARAPGPAPGPAWSRARACDAGEA